MGSVEHDTTAYLESLGKLERAELMYATEISERASEVAADIVADHELIREPLLALLDSDKHYKQVTSPLIALLQMFKDTSGYANDLYRAIYAQAALDNMDEAAQYVIDESRRA